MAMTTPNEGKLTVTIEKQTSKIPFGVYLAASLTLKYYGKGRDIKVLCNFLVRILVMEVFGIILLTDKTEEQMPFLFYDHPKKEKYVGEYSFKYCN